MTKVNVVLSVLFACWSVCFTRAEEAKNVTISVAMSFHGKQPTEFREASCLVLTAEESGMADGPRRLLQKLVVRDPKLESGSNLKYHLEFPRGKVLEGTGEVDVSAVVNNGWCSTETKDEWIRKGDFFTDTSFTARVRDETGVKLDHYMKIFLVSYS